MFQTDWLSVCVTHQPFEYNMMIQRTLLRGRVTSIIMKLNKSNKEVKYQQKKKKKKKKKKRTYENSNSGPFGCKLCTKTT